MAWIGIVDRSAMKIVPVASAGADAGFLKEIRERLSLHDGAPTGHGPAAMAVKEKQAVVVNEMETDPRIRHKNVHVDQGTVSLAFLPLLIAGEPVAVLALHAAEAGYFDEAEMKLLTELAGDIAFAIDNIGMQQKLDKLARMRAVSGEVNAAIIRIHDREALLRETCRIAVEHGKFELVWIALIDQGKQRIQPVAWAGFPSEIAHDLTWANLSRPGVTLAEVIRTRKVTVRNDINTEVAAGTLRQEAVKQGYRSTVCVPFMVHDSVVAAIILFAPGLDFFDEEELALLNEVAANVSFALEHIEKEEKLARLSRIQAVMGSINALIVRVRDRDELFREACRIAVEDGNFGMAWIGLLDATTLDITPVAWAGSGADEYASAKSTARSDTPAGQGAVGRAIRERRPGFPTTSWPSRA